MSTFDLHVNTQSLPQSIRWDALLKQGPVNVFRALGELAKAWKYRRSLARLLDYNDHMLADMGLTRGDLYMALDLPLTADVKKALNQWRAERQITG